MSQTDTGTEDSLGPYGILSPVLCSKHNKERYLFLKRDLKASIPQEQKTYM